MQQASFAIPGQPVSEEAGETLAQLHARLPKAILLLEGAPALFDVRRMAFEAGVAHHPVIDFRSRPAQESDIAVAGTGEAAVADALTRAEPMLARLAELPRLADRPDSEELQVLAIAYLRGGELGAVWDPSRPEMVTYPKLCGLTDPRDLLDRLSEADLLSRRLFDRLHQCASCGASRLNVREECPACRSGHLEDESLIHHYRCAHQGPERDFRAGDEEGLTCPKCRRTLRHYGVDYDRPSSIMICLACGATTSEPAVGFVCADCGAHTDGDVAEKRPWFHYELTGAGRDALLSGRLPLRSLADSLRESLPGLMRPRDFDLCADLQLRIARRYERPLSGLRLAVRPVEGAREIGSAERDRAFRLVGEIVAQTLRDCDLVTAEQDVIKTLMPETPVGKLEAAKTRLQTRLSESISENFTFSVEASGVEELPKLLS